MAVADKLAGVVKSTANLGLSVVGVFTETAKVAVDAVNNAVEELKSKN